ncbi:interleukin-21 receptor isoform X2 [Hyla sarda]|nr:interleukin-21 receptor isoform X2 [Hyla sarda]XP_056391818.1 interleukin-21 receptor isoform X2 [Hyla sarda]
MMKIKSQKPIATLILLALGCIAPVSQCCQDLLCYIDFIDTLTCEYRKDEDMNTSVSHTLTANWTFEESEDTCILVECKKKHKYICTINMENFSGNDICTITRTTRNNGENSSQLCTSFKIGDKFRPVPPFNLTVSLSENYNISWESIYDNDVMRSGELAYELSYKKDEESRLNQKTVRVLEDEKNVILLRSSFEAGEQYVARIRAHPKSTSLYLGHWSEWSSSITWTTPMDEQKIHRQIWWISGIVGSVAFLGILITCFLYSPLIWGKVWVLVPDPKDFFVPLYEGHQGNFKSWLGPHYIPFTTIPYDGGSTYPEEIYFMHTSGKNLETKMFLPKRCLTEKNQIFRICGCMEEDPGTQCGSQCITSTITTTTIPTTDDSINEEDRSRDDSYPAIKLDSGNMLDHLLDQGSDSQCTLIPKFGAHEDFLRSINMLKLVSIPPEEWELQESPSPEDDENVYYKDNNYNPLSPDSGNSGDFGYPRVCLDMDTIDSGFVDSECGSPVDSNFGHSDIPTTPLNPDPDNEEEVINKRNYVQQWVPKAF